MLEFITIKTHITEGAGIAIYKVVNEELVEYAHVPEIGTKNRWLNIVAIDDLDEDGIIEIVWIQTPHIGGILKAAKITDGTLSVIEGPSQYSNHAIGERNLCLSQLTVQSSKKVFYLPSQNRNKIVGFSLENDVFELFEEIDQVVDFSKSLHEQYDFNTVSYTHLTLPTTPYV